MKIFSDKKKISVSTFFTKRSIVVTDMTPVNKLIGFQAVQFRLLLNPRKEGFNAERRDRDTESKKC